jgi:hypothetical protein
MKNTLVTFGCSFTDFQWPTWSDWMGHYYSNYVKKARGGTGNRAIFHNLIKHLETSTSLSDQQIVIQWTGIVREDLFDEDESNPTYMSGGNVYNHSYFPNNYPDLYFSILQNTFESINYIKAAKLLLENYNIDYLMTFMLDPRITSHLGEPGFDLNSNNTFKNKKLIKAELKRLDNLIDSNFTNSCITMHQYAKPYNVYSYLNPETGKVDKDGHPGPYQHYTFFRDYIVPKIKTKEFLESTELLKCVEDWDTFARFEAAYQHKKHLEPKTWPSNKRFFHSSEINLYTSNTKIVGNQSVNII